MRDIRAGLKERLDAIAKERVALRTRLTEAEQAESTLRTLLQQEENKFGKLEPTLPFNGNGDQKNDSPTKGNTPLSQFIIRAVQASSKPLMLEDFKQLAELQNFDFGDKAPGRVLHWALVGMHESNILERTENGGYKLKQITQ